MIGQQNLTVKDHVFVTVGKETFPGVVLEVRSNWIKVAGRGSVDAGPYLCIYDQWFNTDAPQIKIKKAR